MKRFFYLLAIALLLVACGNKGQQTKMIETEVPERPAGQSDVLRYFQEVEACLMRMSAFICNS